MLNGLFLYRLLKRLCGITPFTTTIAGRSFTRRCMHSCQPVPYYSFRLITPVQFFTGHPALLTGWVHL